MLDIIISLEGVTQILKDLNPSNASDSDCIRARVLKIAAEEPCVHIVSFQRNAASIEEFGYNSLAEWKLDSSMIVVATSKKHLIFIKVDSQHSKDSFLYVQRDSKINSLKRESAELFTKESIPSLMLSQLSVCELTSNITSLVCIRDEIMVCTCDGSIKRILWDAKINTDYCLRLPRIPFAIDQQLSKAMPLNDEKVYVSDLDYSPLLGGFSLVFSDGRAAFLTGPSLMFEPNAIQGIWAQNVYNASCTATNHKFRLIAYGLQNAQGIVYAIDEVTGALQVSYNLVLSPKDFPDAEKTAGAISCLAWSPDGSTLVLAWENGGISVWSVFGCLLMCTLNWMSGYDGPKWNFSIRSIEWALEGYCLWMVANYPNNEDICDKNRYQNIVQLQFIKSALTVNPCMSAQSRVFLQGDDRVYINAGDAVIHTTDDPYQHNDQITANINIRGNLLGNKQWLVVQYACIDDEGEYIGVAGITGFAHFCISLKRWKLFGNESQERDFVVTGGMLWWKKHIIVGCYNFLEHRDEVRLYTRNHKLDNSFVKVIKVSNQVLLLSRHEDSLAIFTADSQICVYDLHLVDKYGNKKVEVQKEQVIDISALIVHPACIVSITLTSLRAEAVRKLNTCCKDLSIIINICGKLVMVQRDCSSNSLSNGLSPLKYSSPVVLASCVENVWVSPKINSSKLHLTEALWISCGAHGMRVWLPLFPRDGEKPHNFMSKRIMLPIQITICPLAVLFEDAVILGAENDFVAYSEDKSSLMSLSLPYSVVNRTFRILLFILDFCYSLGLHAWEIARSCNSLPYFPHSLELLLHEVLEEEATSSEPIPDALLPRVVDFIKEFPVFLQTVVQCARKIEIALWHYLFSTVGNPHILFQECLDKRKLETAASYLIILQNLESSNTSRQHATLLLDSALECQKWDVNPQDLDSSPRTPNFTPLSATSKYPAVGPYTNLTTSPECANEEDLSSMLGLMQVLNRNRTHSSGNTNAVKLSSPQNPDSISTVNSINKQMHGNVSRSVSDSRVISRRRQSSGKDFNNDYFLDVILTRHAKNLLSTGRIYDLGHFAAHLDFHLISFFKQERYGAARIDDFVMKLKKLHSEFKWPYPVPQHPVAFYSNKTTGASKKWNNPVQNSKSSCDKSTGVQVAVSSNLRNANSKIGDSGYISNSATDNTKEKSSFVDADYDSQTLDAFLSPHSKQDNDSILGLDMSDESSLWSDEPAIDNDDSSSSWSGLTLNQDLDVISQELASKGTYQSEIQLRYLLQLMLEAGCFEWSLLISVVLRDVMAIIRTINCARQPDSSEEAIIHLRDGLITLGHWFENECMGYRPFICALQNQVQLLNKYLNTTPRVLKLQSQSSSSSSVEIPSSKIRNNSNANTGSERSLSSSLENETIVNGEINNSGPYQ
ncbi:RAB6A-GEF complex partner protein 1 [Nymphon striatum]|nr:RAB6A-GEF complex partner protein 1 [Nymphon striatum]